jgi:hypothetical protein
VGITFAAKAMAVSEIIIAQMFGFGKLDPRVSVCGGRFFKSMASEVWRLPGDELSGYEAAPKLELLVKEELS